MKPKEIKTVECIYCEKDKEYKPLEGCKKCRMFKSDNKKIFCMQGVHEFLIHGLRDKQELLRNIDQYAPRFTLPGIKTPIKGGIQYGYQKRYLCYSWDHGKHVFYIYDPYLLSKQEPGYPGFERIKQPIELTFTYLIDLTVIPEGAVPTMK